MSLHHLVPELTTIPSIRSLLHGISDQRSGAAPRHVQLADVPSVARPAVIAASLATETRPALIVTSRGDRAEALAASLSTYVPDSRPIEVWPAPEGLPFEQLPFDPSMSAERVRIMSLLHGDETTSPAAVIVTLRGLLQPIMPEAALAEQTRVVRTGDRLAIDEIVAWAMRAGYALAPLVQEPGTIARRGGLIDLFVPGAPLPVRIDFFGDEVESIRTFEPGNQRSHGRVERIALLPPSEVPLWLARAAAEPLAALDTTTLRDEVNAEWQRMVERLREGLVPASIDLLAPYLLDTQASIADYFGLDALVIQDDPSAIATAASSLTAQASELQLGFVANGELPSGLRQPFVPWADVSARLIERRMLSFGEEVGNELFVVAEIADAPLFANRLSAMVDMIGRRLIDRWAVVIATDQVDRLAELFEEHDIFPKREKSDTHQDNEHLVPAPGTLVIQSCDITGGWELEDGDHKLLLLTDFEIFGYHKTNRRTFRRTGSDAGTYAANFTPGEFVVHIDHGIAQFTGLVRMEASGVEREYMLLEYAKGDKLYVPVDQSDRVSRFSGGGIEPERSKLGSGEWVRTKQRVRKAVREMAWELIQLYASRETAVGHRYSQDVTWDHELSESFPFMETPDQMQAIIDVKNDMESNKPMDRLVCGDVGFGKTEVALRAAFKAVNGGKQVAVLVPTTVLALQHFQTFMQRLAPFPIRIEMLSRLRNRQEQREILDKLAKGAVDIVVGTHRLVQSDVTFRDLGLVVIDEEQRFGVRQKEFLKRVRAEVDVISMSATPIPRTLHMSLAGIRDISMIDTAPQARLPIRTFVTEFSDTLVREVILRELDRGGQIYIVHNRVLDIDQFTHKLRNLVPEARFGVGHGQMDESVLEEIILGFVRHDFDVLISTTIIESGIDIPNVNTMIIDNADTLGLTQLYQLRGRVGRSTNRAYAYLLYRPGKALSEIAQERLEAIQEATELGAGMRVAMRDLEIRGAGNILGAEQSGHIGSIGFELYLRLLSQAVEEIKQGHPTVELGAVQLDLPLTALIPADYVVDTELRLATYRRVASVTSADGLQQMRAELVDRFGPIPVEVEHLLALIAVRLRCESLGIESVVEREREIVIRPVETERIDQRPLKRALGRAVRFTPNSIRVRLADLDVPWEQALDLILDRVAASRTADQGSNGARQPVPTPQDDKETRREANSQRAVSHVTRR